MAERELKKHSTSSHSEDVASDEEVSVSTEKGDKLKAEIDDILDEIDEVLEENAEEFVRGYVQKGGQ
jgi:ubiquitin-like protein Pup